MFSGILNDALIHRKGLKGKTRTKTIWGCVFCIPQTNLGWGYCVLSVRILVSAYL